MPGCGPIISPQADLPKLMAFLHRRGVRGYVTFNTLVFTNELAEARGLPARDHRRRRRRGHRAGCGHLPADPGAVAGFPDPLLDADDDHERRGLEFAARTGLRSWSCWRGKIR